VTTNFTLELFWLLALIWLGSCGHFNLACILWTFFMKMWFILFSFILIHYFPLACKFSKAASLFEILNSYSFQTSTSFRLLNLIFLHQMRMLLLYLLIICP